MIPGMYDDVRPPSLAEKHSWSMLPFDEEEFLKREVGSSALTGEKGYSVLERVWARPTLEVHGIAGGFTGAGAKTVIPAKARSPKSACAWCRTRIRRRSSRRTRNSCAKIRPRESRPKCAC